MRNIALGVSSSTGDEFFRSMVGYLSGTLQVDYAFIAELADENHEMAKTIAVCKGGEIIENFEYLLAHTPCGNVVRKNLCCYPVDVQQQFPQDRLLSEMGIEGYAGTPLFDSAGNVIGLMVVMSRRPLNNPELARSIVQIFAVRASAELERSRIEKTLRERTIELQRVNEQLRREIAERTRFELETIRAARLASLGELAAGVAHEINNPINGIINYAQILINKTDRQSSENEIAGRIMKEGDRIACIVKSLLSFARERKGEKVPVSIQEVLSDSLALTEAHLRKSGINLRVSGFDGLPEVIANPQQIQQVFLNVINNARYALSQKYPDMHGNKVLEISGEEIRESGCPYVRVIFHDRGTGMPTDILDKVMDPFFTTKPRGIGTGLGLSISHGIISDHRGDLSIESAEGEYTKVIIDLPAAGREE
ncbi:MAG: ATP-binding protein [Nitrospiraceae bacterium]|nr:ATP-binding protein [Nitrospiraceae bacterium]